MFLLSFANYNGCLIAKRLYKDITLQHCWPRHSTFQRISCLLSWVLKIPTVLHFETHENSPQLVEAYCDNLHNICHLKPVYSHWYGRSLKRVTMKFSILFEVLSSNFSLVGLSVVQWCKAKVSYMSDLRLSGLRLCREILTPPWSVLYARSSDWNVTRRSQEEDPEIVSHQCLSSLCWSYRDRGTWQFLAIITWVECPYWAYEAFWPYFELTLE